MVGWSHHHCIVATQPYLPQKLSNQILWSFETHSVRVPRDAFYYIIGRGDYTPPEPGKKNIGLTAIEYLQVYSLCIVPPSHDPQRRTRYIWMPTQADISAHQPCRMWHSIVSEPIKIVSTQCLLVELGK